MKLNSLSKSMSVMAVAVIASLAFAGCGGESSSDGGKASAPVEKQLVRISSNQIEAHPDVRALKVFEQEVEKKLGDKFDIQIYPNATLGANEKVLELVKQGSVQFLVLSTANIETFDPLYSLFSIPYVFTSEEVYEKYISDPETIKKLNVNEAKNGFSTMVAFTAGTRNFYSIDPIRSVEDMKGKKIRVQASPTNVAMLEALGAAATPMAYGDVYSALQQHVIDGAENAESTLTDMKHGEVCKYFSYDMHQMSPDMLVGSYKFLQTLTPEERKVFDEAAEVARAEEFKLWHEHTKIAIDKAKKELGVEFITVNVDEFREKVLPLHQDIMEKNPAIKPMYEEIMKLQQGK